MSELEKFDPAQRSAALKKLAQHLSSLNTGTGTDQVTESEMLSLIISGTLNGENISSRFPAFHQKLLEDPELRQAFLDVLESVETDRAGELIPMPGASQTKLDFLNEAPASAKIELSNRQKWRATWQRTLEQLQTIFSPPELAYRADPGFSDDPWFTLLRDEININNLTYDIALECTISEESEDTLSAYINVAVTPARQIEISAFPVQARLNWGEYQETVAIQEEGRVKFPDIAFASVFDEENSQLRAGFELTLEASE